MATKNRASTSSDATEPLKPSPDLFALGKRIVTEFGLDESTDTLSRWMAHRVAELMERAEHARTKAARDSAETDCEALILRLWERRTSWPEGWPPPSAATALERLASAEEEPDDFGFSRNRAVDSGERTWLGTLLLIADLSRIEVDIWRDAALLELDDSEINDWLDNQAERLSDDERATLKRLINGGDRARHRLDLQRRQRRLAGADDERDEPLDMSLLASRIDDLAERRAEILGRVRPSKPQAKTGKPALTWQAKAERLSPSVPHPSSGPSLTRASG